MDLNNYVYNTILLCLHEQIRLYRLYGKYIYGAFSLKTLLRNYTIWPLVTFVLISYDFASHSSPAPGASCFSCTVPSLFLSSGLCTYCSLCLEHSSMDFLMGSPLTSLGSQRGLPDHSIQRTTTPHFLAPHLAFFFIPFLNTYDIVYICIFVCGLSSLLKVP